MIKEQVYIDLSNRITSYDLEFVSNFLTRHSDLDMTYSGGKPLRLAIEGDGSVAITKLLINYFETTQLPKLAKGSPEYNILKYRFKTSLETAIEGEAISDEMKSLLSRYIDFDHDNEQNSAKDLEILAPDEENHDGLSDEHITREGSGDDTAYDSLTGALLTHGHNPVAYHDTIETWFAGHSTAASEDL